MHTAHTQAKEQVKHGLQTLVSVCNQNIVRCTEQSDLFSLICQDAVKLGGMKTAWIGMVDGQSHHLKPVAIYGTGIKYFNNLQIDLGTADQNLLDPAGRAIRLNSPLWNQDFLHDPGTAAWHESGNTAGWLAHAALPLSHNGKAIGALSLYAGIINAFDEDDRHLLTEMATNINYALASFARETERKKAETELHKYQLLFKNAGWGMAIVEPQTYTITYANSVFLKMHGYAEGEMDGMNLADTFAPESRSEIPKLAGSVHEAGHLTYESLHQRKDGAVFPCLTDVTAFKDAAGHVLFRAATFTDISARKQIEAENVRLLDEGVAARNEAVASREMLNAIFERVHDGFIALDKNWCYSYVNARAAKMLQRKSPDELIGKHIWTEYPDGVGQPYYKAYHKAMETQQPIIFEDYYPPWDLWFENRVYPSLDGLTIYFTEITQRKRAEREATDLRDQLIQATKMEAVGQLTAGIAHDFNNILGAILGYTELSQFAIADGTPEIAAPYLASINKAGNRAKDMIAQMLTFSRNSADAAEDVPIIDLTSIVKEVAALLRSSIPSTINLNYRIDAENPKAAIHAVHLHQIIVNLSINARDAIKEYGKIDISLATFQAKDEFCSSCIRRFKGDYAKITVSDSGSGISNDDINRIFDPFFTTKDIGKGTGMGLSVVHGLVHFVGGHIVLETSDSGTCFSILLPLVTHPSTKPLDTKKPSAITSKLLSNRHLLLIDDEIEVGNMLQEFLIMCGAKVDLCNQSSQALDAFSAHPNNYDLVITDETMPGLTGMHLAEHIMQTRPQLPVILLTGYSENINAEIAAEKGLAGFFYKPVRMHELLDKIQGILGKPES